MLSEVPVDLLFSALNTKLNYWKESINLFARRDASFLLKGENAKTFEFDQVRFPPSA